MDWLVCRLKTSEGFTGHVVAKEAPTRVVKKLHSLRSVSIDDNYNIMFQQQPENVAKYIHNLYGTGFDEFEYALDEIIDKT